MALPEPDKQMILRPGKIAVTKRRKKPVVLRKKQEVKIINEQDRNGNPRPIEGKVPAA